MVRRGFPVKIQLKTAGETFNPDIHVLVLEFELDEKVLIKEEDRFRRVRVRSPKEVRLDQSQWRAELMGIEDSFVDVRLTFPSRAPVACWKLRVLSGFWTSKTQMSDLEETFYSRLHAPVIYCIFNPFLVGWSILLNYLENCVILYYQLVTLQKTTCIFPSDNSEKLTFSKMENSTLQEQRSGEGNTPSRRSPGCILNSMRAL